MKPFLPTILLLMLSACGGQTENNTASMETASMEAVVWRADASHMDDPREVLKANQNFKGQAIFYDRREKAVYLVGKKIAGFDFRQLSPLEAETAHPVFRHFLQCVPMDDCSLNDEMKTCEVIFELISELSPEESGDPLDQVESLMMARGYLFRKVLRQKSGNRRPTIVFSYADYKDECNYLEADVRRHLPHLVGKRITEEDVYFDDY